MSSKEYNRKYYQEHQEQRRLDAKKWYEENKDKLNKEELKDYHAAYYKANRDKWPRRTREQQDQYNATRRDKYASDLEYQKQQKAAAKAWQDAHPQKRKANRIKKFGITLEEFNQIMQKQGSCCAICGYSDQSNKKFFPMVDHDHVSGKVRGLLCSNCNQAIGKFKDDITIIESAISYLRRNGNG
ncbi:endonuclease VII domain-containing protein [Candidatus Pacearchaeota archaeon]|jgi:hypothetical protein|nr:endonuclease VII domain-containing protein [Candidatus Pacearchaeota archaeon]